MSLEEIRGHFWEHECQTPGFREYWEPEASLPMGEGLELTETIL